MTSPYKYELFSNHPENLVLEVEDHNDGLTYSTYLLEPNNVTFYLNGTGFFIRFPATSYKDSDEAFINSINLMIIQLKAKIKNPENFKDDDLEN